MISSYDVVVVGAGPAGSTSARLAAENGANVLMLEKDREVGIPVRCGEAVGGKGFEKVLDLRDEWVSNKIDAVRLVAPDGTKIQVSHDDVGYILDRKRFDYDLARMAAEKGVKVGTKAFVYDLLMEDGVVSGVKVNYMGKHFDIKAGMVIAADGVESRVGRWAGLKTHVRLKDIEPCVQMTVSNIEIDGSICDFYVSRELAPGGYLWVFPKSAHHANIGLGISGEYAREKSPLEYLREFMDRNFPDAAILTTVAGGVPCAPYTSDITAPGLLLVGDAAHQVNPITGGGIIHSILAGEIAGRVAAAAVQDRDVSKKRLNEYIREWDKIGGVNHRHAYRLKEAVYKLTDADLNKTAASLKKKPQESYTIVNIFKTALFQHPKLIPDILKVFLG